MDPKALACVIGAVLINLTLGTFYSIGNVAPYIASYMRKNGNPDASKEDGTWITALYLLGQGVFLIVGYFIERMFDSRVACIFGCVIHCISTYLTIWALNVNMFTVILFYGLGSGMGCGSAYMASMIAIQKWFPTRKGLFTGIIVGGFGLGGLIFTTLQTMYMNPENKLADSLGYFDESVYSLTPKLFLYSGIIYTVVQTIGCILAFPPPKESKPEVDNNNRNTIVVEDQLPNMTSCLSAFAYKIFYIIGFMMMAVAPGVTFVNGLGKRYGQTFINDDKFLASTVAVAAVANASGRLTWGYLADKLAFSTCYLLKVVLFTCLILAFPFDFVLQSKTLFMIWMLGLFFGFSGTFVLFPIFVEQVFGARYHGVVYGMLYIALAASSIATSMMIKLFINIERSFFSRFLPCLIIACLYITSLVVYRFVIPIDRLERALRRRMEEQATMSRHSLSTRKDLFPIEGIQRENSLGSIVRFVDPP